MGNLRQEKNTKVVLLHGIVGLAMLTAAVIGLAVFAASLVSVGRPVPTQPTTYETGLYIESQNIQPASSAADIQPAAGNLQ
jgi:hypothetical protein